MTTSSIPLKRCSKCGQEFPATTDHFSPNKHTKSGLQLACRACRCASQKQYYQANSEERREYSRRYARANREQKHEYNQRYYETNRDRLMEHQREYYQANREWDLEKKRSRRALPEVREQNRERHRRYYQINHQKILENGRRYYELNGEQRREYNRQYDQTHPEKRRTIRHRRRARKLAAGGSHTAEDVQLQIRTQTDAKGKLRCWWCEKIIKGRYHVDHRIPLSKGGSNDARNICITHVKCNLRKRNKLPHEYNGRLL